MKRILSLPPLTNRALRLVALKNPPLSAKQRYFVKSLSSSTVIVKVLLVSLSPTGDDTIVVLAGLFTTSIKLPDSNLNQEIVGLGMELARHEKVTVKPNRTGSVISGSSIRVTLAVERKTH